MNDNRKDDVMKKNTGDSTAAPSDAQSGDSKQPLPLDAHSGDKDSGQDYEEAPEPTPSGPSAEVQALNSLIMQNAEIISLLKHPAKAIAPKPAETSAPAATDKPDPELAKAVHSLFIQNAEIIGMLRVNLSLKKADLIYAIDKPVSKAIRARALALIGDLA